VELGKLVYDKCVGVVTVEDVCLIGCRVLHYKVFRYMTSMLMSMM